MNSLPLATFPTKRKLNYILFFVVRHFVTCLELLTLVTPIQCIYNWKMFRMMWVLGERVRSKGLAAPQELQLHQVGPTPYFFISYFLCGFAWLVYIRLYVLSPHFLSRCSHRINLNRILFYSFCSINEKSYSILLD